MFNKLYIVAIMAASALGARIQFIPANDAAPAYHHGASGAAPIEAGPRGIWFCNEYYKVEADDTCRSISRSLDVDVGNLYYCNPEINSRCSNLSVGQVIRYN